jgi:hypothetical protein
MTMTQTANDSCIKEMYHFCALNTVKPVYSDHLGEIDKMMNILKRKREILDNFGNNASSSTLCYWKLYFCLLNIFIYLFVCFIQIIGDLYMKGFDFSTKYCTLVVNKHFSLHLMFLIMFYLLFCSCRNITLVYI